MDTIQFEGRTVAYLAPEDLEELEAKLAAAESLVISLQLQLAGEQVKLAAAEERERIQLKAMNAAIAAAEARAEKAERELAEAKAWRNRARQIFADLHDFIESEEDFDDDAADAVTTRDVWLNILSSILHQTGGGEG